MGRGGRGSGGRGYSVPRTRSSAPPPAPRKQAPAPAAADSSSGPGFVSSLAEGWWFCGGWAMMNRAVDAVFGPRKLEVVHTTAADPAPAAAGTPCDIHAQAFQDCIKRNGSDISRCQFYVDLLNDCRRKEQVAVVDLS